MINFIILKGATWPAAHVLAVTWFKPKHLSGFVSCYTGNVSAAFLNLYFHKTILQL